MARITVGQAAKAGYAARATIYRHAKAGKITLIVDGPRQLVDVADLIRLYGEPKSRAADIATASAPDVVERVDLERRISDLDAERKRLVEEAAMERAAARGAAEAFATERAQLLAQQKQLLDMVENGQRLLTDQRPAPGLWNRIFGAK